MQVRGVGGEVLGVKMILYRARKSKHCYDQSVICRLVSVAIVNYCYEKLGSAR